MIRRNKFDLYALANIMLDEVPAEVFQSKSTTFIDPAMGGGQFCHAVENRLRDYSHDQNNIQSRVHGFESVIMDIRFAVNKYKLIGSYSVVKPETYLKLSKEELGMQFNVDLGNPPYVAGDGETNIYHRMVDFDADVVAKILPISWFLSDQKAHKEFREQLIEHGLKKIKVLPMDFFPGAQVKTAMIVSIKGHSGNIEVEDLNGNIIDYDPSVFDNKILITPDQKFTATLAKFFKQESYKILGGKSHVTNRRPEEGGAKLNPTKTHSNPVITKLSGKQNEYSYTKNIEDDNTDTYRVVFSYLSTGYNNGNTDIGVVQVVEPGVQIAKTYRYIICSSKAEAESLANYLKSTFVRTILKYTRTSRTMDGPQLAFVPKLVNNKARTDEAFAKMFNFSQKKIEVYYEYQ